MGPPPRRHPTRHRAPPPRPPEQRETINRLLDGFEGKLTSSKWAKLTKRSQDTALRDIDDLVRKGIPTKEADYLYWTLTDTDIHRRVNELIEDMRRHPSTGLAKPEGLKRDLSGWWSRRITGQHRLVYRVKGRMGEDPRIEIIQCRFHY